MKHKGDYISTDNPIICKICGFSTHSYKDMVEHLACLEYNNKLESRTKYENCVKRILEIKQEKRK